MHQCPPHAVPAEGWSGGSGSSCPVLSRHASSYRVMVTPPRVDSVAPSCASGPSDKVQQTSGILSLSSAMQDNRMPRGMPPCRPSRATISRHPGSTCMSFSIPQDLKRTPRDNHPRLTTFTPACGSLHRGGMWLRSACDLGAITDDRESLPPSFIPHRAPLPP